VNEAAGASTAGLHAGAAGEDDHDVLTKGFLIFLNAGAEAFAGGNHNGDGDDAPGDSEHGQESAPFMCPESGQRVAEKVAE